MTDRLGGLAISISGIVQGVGFRPFVYTLATKFHLTGRVWNTSGGVEIEVFGLQSELEQFLSEINTNPPILARIDTLTSNEITHARMDAFSIVESQSDASDFLPVSADMSICQDCWRELFDPADRRYRYPFINCTNCGPRFSIIRDIPYDRPKTSMADFDLCDACRSEYENPLDRRFHAQPVACAECGPRVEFVVNGQISARREGALGTARQFLQDGKIVAIKGLGGYHLACDASNIKAVQQLRSHKKRSDRPFALMAFSLETIRAHCEINEDEAALLQTPQHPIVLLKKKADGNLPEEIAPGQHHLGFMLPYTPLHALLLEPDTDYPGVLVMTSGNLSDEPICYEDDEALVRLKGIADGFLLHNRPIHMRVDDSVVRLAAHQPYFIRRSRGYAPDPLKLGMHVPEILACGAELKNTFCLSRREYAFLSHHIGDLENFETLRSFEEGIQHFERLFRVKPGMIAVDLHPDYLSTQYGNERSLKDNLPLVQVQHHHAHLAACLADNQNSAGDTAIGLIFDGTGYGTDGKIWGGEVLTGSYATYERRFHLEEVPLPGGDAAIRHPARIALGHLFGLGIAWDSSLAPMAAITDQEKEILHKQLEQGINCIPTSSMGRLFDAVSALVGIRQVATYEGQAAIELENACSPDHEGEYLIPLNSDQIEFAGLFNQIVEDMRRNTTIPVISARFHNGLAKMCLHVCLQLRQESGLQTVALSGGVWQNCTLLEKTTRLLSKNGFTTLWHHQVPANDGGIALGQLMVAAHQVER